MRRATYPQLLHRPAGNDHSTAALGHNPSLPDRAERPLWVGIPTRFLRGRSTSLSLPNIPKNRAQFPKARP
jgi:hypothetical protein